MNTWTLERLLELEPYEFEELLGYLFIKMGYKAEVTQRSRDAGIDIIISIENFGLSHTWLVQAKRYSEPVGVKEVREYSSLRYRDNVDGVIIATTSYFTKEAQKEAAEHNVKLLDGLLLLKMLEHYVPENKAISTHQHTIYEKNEIQNLEGTVLKQGEQMLGETEVFLEGERNIMVCTNKRLFFIKGAGSLLSKKRDLSRFLEVKNLLGWVLETPSLYLVMGGKKIEVISIRTKRPDQTAEMLGCLWQEHIRGEHLLKFSRTRYEFVVLTNKRIAKIDFSGGSREISLKDILGTEVKSGGFLTRRKLVLLGNVKHSAPFELDCEDIISWKGDIEAAVRTS